MHDDPDKTAAVPPGDPPRAEKEDGQGRIGTVLAGRYRILKLLGEGAQGAVYVGEHLRIGRKDAIKVLQPALLKDADAVARFTRGASKASHINHPNVCTVYDFGETEEGLPFMASELVSGSELHDVMKREAPLDIERAVDLLEQAAAGLHAAHQLDIVHRDLKPANIMITRSREGREVVKVVDFDIAKGVGESDTGGDLTKAGWIIGTPQYMSPEQITAAELDPRSDIYSLALIFFEMVTGKLPNTTGNTQKLMWERVSGDLASLTDCRPDRDFPPGLQSALDRALHKDPEGRPATAVEFAREVRKAIEAPEPEHEEAATVAVEAPTAEAATVAVASGPAVPETRAESPPAERSSGVPRTAAAPDDGIPPTEAAPPSTAEEPGRRSEDRKSSMLAPALAGAAGLGVAGLAFAWSAGLIGGGDDGPTLSLPGPVELETGASRTLDARVIGPDGGPVADAASLAFASRNARIASVDAAGTLFAGSAGSTWVLVRSGDLEDSVRVTVNAPAEDTRTATAPEQDEGDAADAGGTETATGAERGPGGGGTEAPPAEEAGGDAEAVEDADAVRERVRNLLPVVSEFASRAELESARDETAAALEISSLPAETRALAAYLNALSRDYLGESAATWCPFALQASRLDPTDVDYRTYAEGCREPAP